jgi:hypothetical protein
MIDNRGWCVLPNDGAGFHRVKTLIEQTSKSYTCREPQTVDVGECREFPLGSEAIEDCG